MTATRVLMTADTVGGVWTYCLELAGALAPHGVEVHLATMGPRMTGAQRAAAAAAPVASVHEGDFALEWMPDPWTDVDAAGEWLLATAEVVGADVVHLNGYAHAPLPWAAPTVVVAHSDVVSWWRAVHHGPPPREWSTYVDRVTAGLSAADAVVAPTAAVAADLRRGFGCDRAVVVPNCRRSDWVRDVDKEALIVGAGRAWDEAKNLAALQRLAPALDWPVVVANGSLGWPEVADLLLRASVYVAPARYEPFGLGVLEAAQAGCALVLGDIPSLREVWADAAAYVDPNDDHRLLDVLRRHAEDDRWRRRMGDAARVRAASYTPGRTAQGYLDVYWRLPARVGAVG